MKNNVINPQFSIPFEKDGELGIIGCDQYHVLLVLRGQGSYMDDFPMETQFGDQAWGSLHSRQLDDDMPMIFFEYEISGKIRNPRQLLKSIRNRLMRVMLEKRQCIEKVQREFPKGPWIL